MPLEKQKTADKIIYLWLFLIAFAVVFSSTYNPMNFRRMHVDSSVYITIAQGITRGQLPYRDFVDNKGPFAYFLNVPGLFLGNFTGVWITEIVLMFVSVLFAYKTALFFGGRNKALLGTAFSFIVLIATFTVKAGTEEYSLPFLMISLYLFVKYYFSPKQDISLIEVIVLGACFSCAVLIRLNMFPLWAGFCVVIFIESLIKRHFALLGKYTAGFCIGIFIVVAPIFWYLKSNGIIDDFLEQVILGGAVRGFGGGSIKETVKNFYIVFYRNFSFVPLLFSLLMLITKFERKKIVFYGAYTFSWFLMLLFLSFSSGESHYNMVLVPFFVPAFVFLIDIVYSAIGHPVFSAGKVRKTVVVLFFCIFLSEGIIKSFYDLPKIFLDNSGSQLINAGRMIDENTMPGDTIISLGYNAYIYPFTTRKIASRYFFQGSGFYPPNAKEDFLNDILNKPPRIIADFTAEGINSQYNANWHPPVYEMIQRDYRLLSDENGFNLYIRN